MEHMEAEYSRLMATTNQQETQLYHLEQQLSDAKASIESKEKEIAALIQRHGSSPSSGSIDADDILQVSH